MRYRQNETLFLKYLGSSPVLRIIDYFLDNPLSDFSKNEIVRNLEMGRVTFFRYWAELEKSGAVKETRKIGRATLYKLDREKEIVKHLAKLEWLLQETRWKRLLHNTRNPFR